MFTVLKLTFPLFVLIFTFIGLPGISAASNTNAFHVKEPVFGAMVYMQEAGKQHSDTIVLVHGLGDLGSLDWEKVLPLLAEKHHVITFDLPGFGNSEKGNKLYSPTQYAHFLKWVIDTYSVDAQPVTMIGHSMGGAISLRYASLYPETLRRLIMVDAAGILHRSAFAKASIQSQLEVDGWLGNLVNNKTKAVGNWLGDLVVKSDKIPVPVDTIINTPELRSTVLAESSTTIAALALLQEDFSDAIANLKVPTRIIWGRDDEVAPLRTGLLLHAKLPTSKLDIIDDAGHVPMKSQPEIFHRLLINDLANSDAKAKNRLPPSSTRDGICNGESDKLFSGSYRNIRVTNCKGVKLEGVVAKQLEVKKSEIEIYDSYIESTGTAIISERSRIVATALNIKAEIGISTYRSKLDLAGAEIGASKSAVMTRSSRASKLVLSVSSIQSSHSSGFKHGTFDITRKSPL